MNGVLRVKYVAVFGRLLSKASFVGTPFDPTQQGEMRSKGGGKRGQELQNITEECYSNAPATFLTQLFRTLHMTQFTTFRIDNPAFQSSLPELHTGPQLPQARTSARSSTGDRI